MAHKPYKVHVLHPGYARTYCGKGENSVHKATPRVMFDRVFLMTGQVMRNVCAKCLEAMAMEMV